MSIKVYQSLIEYCELCVVVVVLQWYRLVEDFFLFFFLNETQMDACVPI